MSQEEQKSELVECTDLDQFVNMLMRWHGTKVAVVEHMLSIPEGSSVQLNDGEEIVLSGDTLKGFMVGVTLALIELGVLPFVTQTDEGVSSVDAPVQ